MPIRLKIQCLQKLTAVDLEAKVSEVVLVRAVETGIGLLDSVWIASHILIIDTG